MCVEQSNWRKRSPLTWRLEIFDQPIGARQLRILGVYIRIWTWKLSTSVWVVLCQGRTRLTTYQDEVDDAISIGGSRPGALSLRPIPVLRAVLWWRAAATSTERPQRLVMVPPELRERWLILSILGRGRRMLTLNKRNARIICAPTLWPASTSPTTAPALSPKTRIKWN